MTPSSSPRVTTLYPPTPEYSAPRRFLHFLPGPAGAGGCRASVGERGEVGTQLVRLSSTLYSPPWRAALSPWPAGPG